MSPLEKRPELTQEMLSRIHESMEILAERGGEAGFVFHYDSTHFDADNMAPLNLAMQSLDEAESFVSNKYQIQFDADTLDLIRQHLKIHALSRTAYKNIVRLLQLQFSPQVSGANISAHLALCRDVYPDTGKMIFQLKIEIIATIMHNAQMLRVLTNDTRFVLCYN